MIVAGGLVSAVNSAAPFDHGSWLAAYLVLVGGVAQILLAAGRPSPAATRFARVELAAWNAGNAGVMGGVLAGLPGLVSAGSGILLVALLCFAADARAGDTRERWHVVLYDAALIGLASSVVVGSALAGAPPGSWL